LAVLGKQDFDKKVAQNCCLCEEWQKRGVKKMEKHIILTTTIAKNTFGLFHTQTADLKA
jgi:hypothetical protein